MLSQAHRMLPVTRARTSHACSLAQGGTPPGSPRCVLSVYVCYVYVITMPVINVSGLAMSVPY